MMLKQGTIAFVNGQFPRIAGWVVPTNFVAFMDDSGVVMVISDTTSYLVAHNNIPILLVDTEPPNGEHSSIKTAIL